MKWCGATHQSYKCCLKARHKGDHQSKLPGGKVIHQWNDKVTDRGPLQISGNTVGIDPGTWSANSSSFWSASTAALLPRSEAPTPRERVQLDREASTDVRVGFRTWALRRAYPDGVHLVSSNGGAQWPHRKRFEARCGRDGGPATTSFTIVAASLFRSNPWPWADETRGKHDDPAPSMGCTCGIYAQNHDIELSLDPRVVQIVGAVSLWGRVIEHDKGFRAQYAYPKELVVVGGDERLRGALEFAYGVTVELW